ncbi:periplasmic heavy metal sensor [Desulfovibrio desulfuricans]|uniref:Periplasmic heavy metal sensor n=1 Tax=Desulfovibrio desulfuricans TaxID=876 RepID=A0A4P7UN14_DESDE|nr:periplasmic heavy metal sensor [Desulfovibrio desulfuricans]QCC86264.1 periplasmic heavy metal sensor [Desulfovibrio desulfuricans]
MKTSKIVTSGAALTLAIFLGIAGVASAQNGDGHGPAGMGPGTGYGMGHGGMGYGMGLTNEQQTAMQQLHQNFAEKMQPTLQQHFAKMAELNNLAAADAKPDDARVKAAQKDLREIDAKLYAARADMLKQMSDKGIPFMAGHGMGRGMGRGMGHGMGHGMMGNGMMGNGDCPGLAGNAADNAVPSSTTGNK